MWVISRHQQNIVSVMTVAFNWKETDRLTAILDIGIFSSILVAAMEPECGCFAAIRKKYTCHLWPCRSILHQFWFPDMIYRSFMIFIGKLWERSDLLIRYTGQLGTSQVGSAKVLNTWPQEQVICDTVWPYDWIYGSLEGWLKQVLTSRAPTRYTDY